MERDWKKGYREAWYHLRCGIAVTLLTWAVQVYPNSAPIKRQLGFVPCLGARLFVYFEARIGK